MEGLSLEVTCLVDIRDHTNKELALRFSTDIESDDTFFTDLNGFQVSVGLGRDSSRGQCSGTVEPPPVLSPVPWQIQPRRYQRKLPLQANFYPMPTMAYIQDLRSRLTLHTAQALGVSSLASGEPGAGGPGAVPWGSAGLVQGWDCPRPGMLGRRVPRGGCRGMLQVGKWCPGPFVPGGSPAVPSPAGACPHVAAEGAG